MQAHALRCGKARGRAMINPPERRPAVLLPKVGRPELLLSHRARHMRQEGPVDLGALHKDLQGKEEVILVSMVSRHASIVLNSSSSSSASSSSTSPPSLS
jgi:hypothetical protein